MDIFYFTSNPLGRLKKELKKYGFHEITNSIRSLAKYQGMNLVALTNHKIVFVFSDKWHDQQIGIELCKYPFNENELVEIEQILVKFGLSDKYSYKDITSYFNQSKDDLVTKQISFVTDVLNSINSDL